MMAQAWKAGTWEMEAGGLGIQGHSLLHQVQSQPGLSTILAGK